MKRSEKKRVRFATEYGCGSLKLVVREIPFETLTLS